MPKCPLCKWSLRFKPTEPPGVTIWSGHCWNPNCPAERVDPPKDGRQYVVMADGSRSIKLT